MEINLLTRDGISEESILSIRAGAVKRQACVTSGRAFRFPKLSMEDNPLRVAILQQVGTAYLVLKPNDDQYRVQFDNGMSCEVEVNKIAGGGGEENVKPAEPEKKETAASATEAKEYLERHQVLQFVQGVLQAVIKEKPKDPYDYMARHFTSGYSRADTRSQKKQVDVPSGEVAKQEVLLQGHGTVDASPANASAKVEASTKVDAPSGEVAKQDVLHDGHVAADASPAKASVPVEAASAPAAEAPKQDSPAAGGSKEATDSAKPVETAGAKLAEEKLEKLRVQVQDTLVTSLQDGTLASSLEVARGGEGSKEAAGPQEELRTRTRDALMKATLDGSLDTVIQAVIREESQPKACTTGELRLRAKDVLLQASVQGSLADSLRMVLQQG